MRWFGSVVVLGAAWWMWTAMGPDSTSPEAPDEVSEVTEKPRRTTKRPSPRRVEPIAEDPPSSDALPPQLRHELDAFFALHIRPDPDVARAQREEDRLYRDHLQTKTSAFLALQTSLEDLVRSAEKPEPKIEALLALAYAREDMGQNLMESTAPSYLEPHQAEVYAETLRNQGKNQLELGLRVLESARAAAESLGPDHPAHARIDARVQAIESQMVD